VHLELRGITKRFPGVVANDSVDLSVESGEILVLLGENGAGKTTLMNILYGLYSADEGEILIDDAPVQLSDPGEAIEAGIGMVHQHFMLVPVFNVAENVVLGVEPIRRLPAWLAPAALAFVGLLVGAGQGSSWPWEVLWAIVGGIAGAALGWLMRLAAPPLQRFFHYGGSMDLKKARTQVTEISRKYGLEVDPNAVVEDLPVGTQQRVEIIKVLFREAEIIVFDEPTAVLTPQEVEDFFGIIHALKDAGKGIIFITHKLKEVMEIADRIVVLRGGKVVGSATPDQVDERRLAEMMVGRPVVLEVTKAEAQPGDAVLEVADLVVLDDRGFPALNGINFTVQRGEIVGVAGVQGNGQTELVEAMTGLRPALSGSVKLLGNDITGDTPRQINRASVAHVPEDRQRAGLVLGLTVAENLVLNSYYRDPFSHFKIMDWEAVAENASTLIEQYDVRTPSVDIPVSTLSGGNQQKVIVAREFSRDVHLVIASQPTRGLDVGSIEYIHTRIVQQRDQGAAVIIVSTELDEIMALSDRILVMYRGGIVAERRPAETTNTELGLFMAGAAV
jgi:ABC-type uncharacterized transport system ATPase subunit